MGMWEMLMLLFFFAPEAPFGQPAPAAKVFKHVPADTMVVLAVDAASLAQGANKSLDRLLDAPFVKNTPALQQGAAAVRMGRQMLISQSDQLGIDPLKDIRYALICFKDDPQKGEKGMIVLGGKFPQKTFDTFLDMSGSRGKEKDGVFVVEEDPSGPQVVVRAKDGTILFGDEHWVRTALEGKHSHPAWIPLLKEYDRKTYLLAAFLPDANMLEEMNRETEPLLRPLIGSLRGASIRLTYEGISIKVLASDAKFARVWGSMLEGLGKWLVAYHGVADGFLDIAGGFLASLDPIAAIAEELHGEDKEIMGALVANRKEIRKLTTRMFLGKKAPRSRLKVNPGGKSAMLTVTGQSPGAILLLPGMMGYLMLVRAEAPMPVEARPVEPPPPEVQKNN
jgi:hypothetical protein